MTAKARRETVGGGANFHSIAPASPAPARSSRHAPPPAGPPSRTAAYPSRPAGAAHAAQSTPLAKRPLRAAQARESSRVKARRTKRSWPILSGLRLEYVTFEKAERFLENLLASH